MEIHELKNYGWSVLLKGVVPGEFCDRLVAKINEHEWKDALVKSSDGQVLNKQLRNTLRIMQLDEELADDITNLLHGNLPQEFDGMKMVKLNPMFRYLKYIPGSYFGPHYDLNYVDIDDNVSMITVQMYLNDDYTGGETIFLNEMREIYRHVPTKGDILLFSQELEHEGALVTSGIKYSVRTEVMYK